jgi:hypothetical protein
MPDDKTKISSSKTFYEIVKVNDVERVANFGGTPQGEVAEWLKAPLSKSGILSKTGSWVRIPPSPPEKRPLKNVQFCSRSRKAKILTGGIL